MYTSLMMEKILIQAQDICHRYNKECLALDHINLTLKADQISTLIGPNGAGKSTLVKILLKILKPTKGHVSHHTDLRVGFMPQKLFIDPTLPLSVAGFLTLGFDAKTSAKNLNTALAELNEQLALNHLFKHPVHSLSGGELQRVLLARALIREPNLLVLDEPVQGIDLQSQHQLYQLIYQQQRQRQCAVLMISHDLHLVMKNTDQVICLNRHVCCSGSLAHIQDHPDFLAQFGDMSPYQAWYQHQPHHCEHSHLDTKNHA
ncbi:metal ABC transporter ATP-binding protein [Thiomicrospira sp. ALE5]|uniref:metal ABC transporter ATP-binding protein n=1 Tax=Thiomicrospira sp. ALE5 TaxID=748650 RepID=UPI0008F295FA|nr:metal ABC transporter ATP-binding protein [Thiomicrospira sp. ALE5]SFR62850.1 zinc transport system ATP-binding protein [Thiomicrospira sp. ALE5]